MRRVISVLLISAAAYVGFAAYSVWGLVSGIQQRDAVAISDHVDFPAVRASIKEQMTSALMAETMEQAKKNDDAGGANWGRFDGSAWPSDDQQHGGWFRDAIRY